MKNRRFFPALNLTFFFLLIYNKVAISSDTLMIIHQSQQCAASPLSLNKNPFIGARQEYII